MDKSTIFKTIYRQKMKANRTDKHHALVSKALEQLGCTVQSLTAVKCGCPDLLVGINGRMMLIEIKTGTSKPRPNQVRWHRRWKGPDVIILSVPADAEPLDILQLCYAAIH